MEFFTELRRRNVFRVVAAYAVMAWLSIQLSDILLGNFGAPQWVFKSLVLLLVIGFMLAVFLSWAYELTPDGVRRSDTVPPTESATPLTGKRIDRYIVVGLVLVILVMVVERFFFAGVSGGEDVSGVAVEAVPSAPEAASPATRPVAAGTSIAVLPFANRSTDPEQAFFADGITEDILTRLAGIGSLRVISRTSMMRYRDTELSLPEIAAQLAVTHVLEGSVRRSGDRVRIIGQLIRAEDDAHLWAESFDRDLADIFTVQAEIAGRIVEALELRLTDREAGRLGQRGTDSVRAWELYLKGREVFSRSFSNPGDRQAQSDEALRWFRAALDEDPAYAAAEAGVARALLWNLGSRAPEEHVGVLSASIEASRRAIRLSPDLADGYVQLGHAHRAEGDDDAALEQYRLAASIAPDDPDTASALGGVHGRRGEILEAIRLARHALVLEPNQADRHDQLGGLYRQIGLLDQAISEVEMAWGEIMPHPGRRECMVGVADVLAGRVEEGRQAARRTIDLEPGSPFGAGCAIGIGTWLRDADMVLESLQSHADFFESRSPLAVAWGIAQTGDAARLERLLDTAERQLRDELPRASGAALAYRLGQIAMFRGQWEQGLDHLQQAVEQGGRSHRVFALDPAWDPVRGDARYIALEEQVESDLERMRQQLVVMDAVR